MAVLHIFDFDDTLVSSDSSVVINHIDGTVSVLPSDEYATYDEQPGDEMDFSEFDSYPKNAELIQEVFEELQSAIISDGKPAVLILTARSNPEPVRQFMSDHGLPDISIHAVGSSDPRDKAKFVLSKIRESKIDLIRVFEDNARNIRAIRKVVKENGETKLQTYRVVDGEIYTR